EHINFFSPISLTNLMRSEGFTLLHWERNQRVPNNNTVEPAISAFFAKADTKEDSPEFDADTTLALNEYIRRSTAVDDGIHRTIEDLANRGVPIVVWGVGTHTQRLLATSR